MIDSKRKVLRWVLACLVMMFVAAPLHGQEDEEEIMPRKAPDEVNPSFLGEKIIPGEDKVDANGLLSKVMEKLGGVAAYEGLEDVSYFFKHKYYLNNKLQHVQTASVYNRMGDRIKTRYDWDYIDPKDFDKKLDYREIVGEDGPFKFLRGKILRGPTQVKEAGERLIRYTASIFVPFCLDPDEANPRYLGEVSWKSMEKGEEKEITCHKVLVEYNRRQGNIEGNVLALYIDKGTYDLKRLVFDLYSPQIDIEKTRVVDYAKRTPVAGVMLPCEMDITDIWEKRLNAVRKVYLNDFRPNTGLDGIAFEMAGQKAKEDVNSEKAKEDINTKNGEDGK